MVGKEWKSFPILWHDTKKLDFRKKDSGQRDVPGIKGNRGGGDNYNFLIRFGDAQCIQES